MEAVKEILINYWKPIVCLILVIIAFILLLVKKKPLNDIFSILIPLVIKGIQYAEGCNYDDPFHKGDDKLQTAIAYVLVNLCDYYGLQRTSENIEKFERYRPLIKMLIEDVLSTPQKKGGKDNG